MRLLPQPGSRARQPHYWTPQEDKLLGTEPDHEVARRLGRTAPAVRYRRRKLEIPLYPARAGARRA